jgi:diguanylate cyclase (GGDEF)-like protein/PAS domain S-box-containing protein
MFQSEVFLDAIINNLPMMVTVIDANTQKFVLANKATEKVFGKPSTIIGKTLHDLLPIDKANEFTARDRAVIKSRQIITFESEYESADDMRLCLSATMIPIYDSMGAPQYLLSIYDDITERRKAEKEIVYLAHHDCLTDIGNRATFYANLSESFAYYKHGGIFALVYLDLDNFKSINDSLGHPVGDKVLISVAERLKEIILKPHHIARLGGDEFAIIFNGIPSAEVLHSAIDGIVSALAIPIEACGDRVSVTASIGVAIGPDDAGDPDALLRNADIALYCAKKEGGNTQRYFDVQMLIDFTARHALENDLRHALENNELKLYYQPLVSLANDRVNGFEALMRWDSPTRGLVSPADFIPLGRVDEFD